MCGVAGIVTRASHGELRTLGPRSIARLAHRGPDGSGQRFFFCDRATGRIVRDASDGGAIPEEPNVFLGHTRLAIIDTTEAGLQPMERQGRWITFNGEIYNYVELRETLKGLGHCFHTNSDTEVLLAAYVEWNEAMLSRLHGIFAFAILDGATGTLFLARDQLGVKPLYYSNHGGHFVFASEIKALVETSLVPQEVDWESVWHFFTFLYAPNPGTFYRDIRQVEPGAWLRVSLSTLQSEERRYFRIERRAGLEKASEDDLIASVRTDLRNIVAQQMRSDVAIGSFLSGGIDSTIVTGLMREVTPRVHSYTVTFPEPQYKHFDESEVAREVASHLGTIHEELPLRLDQPDLLISLLEHFDQPFGNPTLLLMYLIAEKARPHTTVALCGTGGDELFAGYPRHKALRMINAARYLPGAMTAAVPRLLRLLPDRAGTATMRRAKAFFRGLHGDAAETYTRWTYFLAEEDKRAAVPGARVTPSSYEVLRRMLRASDLTDELNRFLEVDVRSFLVDNVLEYTDRMSMRVPVEVRVPLLAPQFVEFALNVAPRHKLRGWTSKFLLRKAFAEMIPPAAKRQPKKGFVVPLAEWFRNELDRYIDVRAPAGFGRAFRDGILSREAVDRMRREHRDLREDHSHALFACLAFDHWYSQVQSS